MMTLLIGNKASRRFNRGFLLIELLVCLVIFTIGWVAVFRPLGSLVALEREMSFRTEANAFFSKQIWAAKDLAIQAKNVNLAAGEKQMEFAGFSANYKGFIIRTPSPNLVWFKQIIEWEKPGGIESQFHRNAILFLPYGA